MQVTVHAAKIHLSKLIEAALAGADVIIARGRKPVVKLVAIPQRKFRVGILEGRLTGPGPNFLEPMSEDELGEREGGR